MITGLALGLALAVIRAFQVKPLNALIVVFVDMFRALPPLVIVLIVYFGLPNVGISIPSFAVLWLVLSLVLAAFAEEIFWAGILSVPKGQWEAARSTGFSFLGTLAYIVLPQAVRLTVPPITNRTVAITKNTALGTVIGVPEILNQATTAQSLLRQRHAADDGRDRLHHPVHSGGGARPLPRNALRLAEELMDALIQQFFNLDIMARALPLVLQGLQQTLLLCLRDPARAVGGLLFALASLSRLAHRALGHDRGDRFLPRRAAAGAADLRLFGPAVRRHPPLAAHRGRGRVLPQHVELLRRDLPRRDRERRARPMGRGALHRPQRLRRRSTYVVLPQAVRNVLPDLVSNTVEVVKLTSIASVVALPELLYSADMARSVTFNASPIVLAAAIYLVHAMAGGPADQPARTENGILMSRIVRVAAAQSGPIQKAESRQAVVKRLCDLLDQAHAQGVNFVVFTELALTTFFPRWYMTDQAEVDQLVRARDAERRDAPAVREGGAATRSASISATRSSPRTAITSTPRSWSTATARSSASTARCTCPAIPSSTPSARSSIWRSAISSRAISAFRCGAPWAASSAWRCATTAAGRRPIA